ncbi:membrane protein [Actinoallomurus liliacearum]|uniref:Membrane protein n=1 Tax=Actinoallomurus liliacearum TaxID=1080073 RepID=A0ABP8TDN2_9ACTN
MATSQLRNNPRAVSRRPMSKVPEVTAYFWIVKVLTTGMGETTSDYLAHRLDPIVAVAVAGIVLAASLALQFYVRRYVAWIYWTAIVLVSVFGTMAADVLHVALGVPYVISTAFFVVALATVFAIWYASERTLSIHSIVTARRELFYWATVMTTFALGTATGDLTAVTLHLGYLASGVMFAVLIGVPALAYGLLRMNAIAAFWVAYVLTRPLGASFADWLGVSRGRGGLALGTGPVSLVLALIIFGFVGYLTVTRRDTTAGRRGAHASGR